MIDSNADLRQIQARLARTRLALVTQMRRHAPASRQRSQGGQADSSEGAGLAAVLRRWWQEHPVRLALDVGTPVLQTFARAYPLPIMAVCVAVGAAVVWLRPWRLLPLSALLMATVRSVPLGDLLAAWRAQAERSADRPGHEDETDRHSQAPHG